MRCEACHGCGAVWVPPDGFRTLDGALGITGDGSAIELTCPECNGSGVAHCCDGICAQPQTEFSE
jgi:hypothetical protein